MNFKSKRFITFFFLASLSLAYAQINYKAPWVKAAGIYPNDRINFNEVVSAGNSYWETRDKSAKGSGYKLFKRWEAHWQNYVDKNGFLPLTQELSNSWMQKNKELQSRNTSSNLNDESNWISLGPTDFLNRSSSYLNLGRINCITPHPNNTDIVFAGAPSGGIWKSEDAGLSYVPLSDNLPQIGVSSINIDYSNPNIIYIATGDDDAGDSYSVGVWKSFDGGFSWNPTALNASNSPYKIYELEMHANNPQVLWAATSDGIYKTINGGVNWVQTQSGAFEGVKQKPGDSDTVYAITDSEFYKSTNGGNNFSLAGDGLFSNSARLVMDVTPANQNLVYVVASSASYGFEGVYKSTDSGNNFVKMANTADIYESNQAWFDLALAVSDTNQNELYVGVLNVWKSSDGGDSFTKLNDWSQRNSTYTHADIHFLKFYNSELYVGSDGGFFKSTNQGSTFIDLTGNMAIGQFYRVSVSKENSNKIAGGTQDNGGFALFNDWKIYHGGDGMEGVIDPNNDNMYYGFMQSGQTLFVNSNSGMSGTQSYSGPANGNWITPLSINNNSEVFAGYSSLYQFENGEFTELSTDLVGGNIDVLDLDPIDSDIIYLGINSSLRRSVNHGLNFETLFNFSSNITSIDVNNNDNNIIYVTTSGSTGGVYKSYDQGASFTDISFNLANVVKNIVKHQIDTPDNVLYLGTSVGVYRYNETTNDWMLYNNGLPNSSVTDLSINSLENKIIASTYGRGIWKSEMSTSALVNDDIKIVKILNPTSELVNCGEIIPQIRVKNNGENPITEIDISYIIGNNTPFGTQTYNLSWTGNLPSLGLETIDLIPLSLNLGNYQMQVNVSIANDVYQSNNNKSVTFQTNNSASPGNLMSFEANSDRLLEVPEYGIKAWQMGQPTGAELNTAWSGTKVYATNLDGNYPDNIKTYLYSPCFDLTTITNPIIKFYMAFDIEFDWDLLYLEYSTDSGENWSLLGDSEDPNWYNSSRIAGDGVNDNCYNCIGAQWTGTSLELNQYSYDLSEIENSNNALFRFVFHTDELVNEEGIIIDDLIIEGRALNTIDNEMQQIAIYPNPSKGIFNIQLNNTSNNHICVRDTTAKLLFEDLITNGTLNYRLDMSKFSTGLYFLEINSNGKKLTKKLILR